MDYSQLQALTVACDDGVATITLRTKDDERRPHQHRELTGIWRQLAADPDVRAVLVTGVGDDEFFLSGEPPGGGPAARADSTTEEIWEFGLHIETEVGDLVRELIRFPKPTVSAINGGASGGGLTLAMLADISIMAEDAWLCDPHIALGVAAGDGAGAAWPLFTGIAKAKLYLMTSDAISGVEAERIGLVSRVVPREQLLPTALDYARRFAAGPEVALRFTKRAVNQWLRLGEVVAQEHALTLEILSTLSGEQRRNPYTEWPPRIVP
jgi:enoyl-CoA hydratase